MFLADSNTTLVSATVTTLDGITTVLVAFFFVCLILPSLVKQKSQFYAAMACLMGIIVVHTMMLMIHSDTFGPFAIGLLQLFAFILLVLCVGGLTVRELSGDMAKAYEVMRRGETTKEVVIPLGDQPRRGKPSAPAGKVYNITDEDDDEDKGIPLS